MDFTNAKIAYEGYCRQTGWKSLATGQDLPAFAKLSEEIKLAWAAAAWHLWQKFNADIEDGKKV